MDDDNEFSFSSSGSFKNAKPVKKQGNFKNLFSSFLCGALGSCLVLGICFGVQPIKKKLLGNNYNRTISTSTESSDSSNNSLNLIDLSEYSETSIAVASSVSPSVVGITVEYSVNSVFGQSVAQASGSGIILTDDGYIVTNNHVISSESSTSYYQITQANKITVKLYNDSTEYEAKVVGTDAYTDLAIIKIEAQSLTPAKLGNSDELNVGEFVMAIGNPLGLDFSVTSGIVSALNREVEDEDGNSYIAIQTDAAINSGNSGGALVNAKGEVVGINSMKLAGSGVEGIGFAIPITSATNIINQLIDNGSVVRPYIGIAGSDITEKISTRYHVPQGVYVEEVSKDSPAEKAGLQQGDIITAINDNEIKTINELNKIKYTYNVGDTVKLKVNRNNEDIEIDIKLSEEPKIEDEDKTTINSNYDLYEEFFKSLP